MIKRTLIIVTICSTSSIVVVMDNYPDVQTIFASDVDFNMFAAPNVSLEDIITDDEVFVFSPYQLVQCLPYFMQVEPVVQEIVRPHLEMNFKFRNK